MKPTLLLAAMALSVPAFGATIAPMENKEFDANFHVDESAYKEAFVEDFNFADDTHLIVTFQPEVVSLKPVDLLPTGMTLEFKAMTIERVPLMAFKLESQPRYELTYDGELVAKEPEPVYLDTTWRPPGDDPGTVTLTEPSTMTLASLGIATMFMRRQR